MGRVRLTYSFEDEFQNLAINVSSTTIFFHYRKEVLEVGLGGYLKPFVLGSRQSSLHV